MREILFRGKNLVTREWVQGDLFQHGDQRFIMADNRNTEVIPETVGQFTGICDQNGVKIFEGDIVKVENALVRGIFTVEYSLSVAFIVVNSKDERYFLGGCNSEVLGNIYDDPELIGGDSNA